jgi:hypothetical protein
MCNYIGIKNANKFGSIFLIIYFCKEYIYSLFSSSGGNKNVNRKFSTSTLPLLIFYESKD